MKQVIHSRFHCSYSRIKHRKTNGTGVKVKSWTNKDLRKWIASRLGSGRESGKSTIPRRRSQLLSTETEIITQPFKKIPRLRQIFPIEGCVIIYSHPLMLSIFSNIFMPFLPPTHRGSNRYFLSLHFFKVLKHMKTLHLCETARAIPLWLNARIWAHSFSSFVDTSLDSIGLANQPKSLEKKNLATATGVEPKVNLTAATTSCTTWANIAVPVTTNIFTHSPD